MKRYRQRHEKPAKKQVKSGQTTPQSALQVVFGFSLCLQVAACIPLGKLDDKMILPEIKVLQNCQRSCLVNLIT